MLSSVIGKFHWEEEDEKSTEYMKFTEIFKIKFEKKKRFVVDVNNMENVDGCGLVK